jgi:hypothetical protein
VRIILNDGAGGTVNTTFLTTADYATVIVFGTTASSTTQGTGIYGASSATAKNFVLLYDNTSGTGRPISGTLVEDDGVTVPIGSSGYASFYTNYVDGVNGSWGCIIPNSLANGVRRIEQRANSDGSLVGYNTESVGIWPSSVNTVNPSGSDGTPLVISSTPLTVNGITVPNLAYTNAPGIARIISLADIQTAGLTSSLASPSYSITGVNSPISAAGTVIYNASNIKYTNSTAITSPGSDSFSYTVSDGASSASGTVTINFGSNVAVGPQLTPRSDGSSHAVVSFHGLPGYSYHIQRATTLGPPADWTNAAPITLSPTGDGFYIWTNTISPADGFYRLSYP